MTTRAFTSEEIAILEQRFASAGRLRDLLMLELLLRTGARVSEILGLTWSQLLSPRGDIETELIMERQTLKGGSGKHAKSIRSRRVPLHASARSAIVAYLVQLGTPPAPQVFVFQSAKGVNRPINREHAFYILKSAARAAGLDARRLGCHSARKTFAKAIHAAAGFDLIKTQRILGHASPLTTARYLETTDEELDALVLGIVPLEPRSASEPCQPTTPLSHAGVARS